MLILAAAQGQFLGLFGEFVDFGGVVALAALLCRRSGGCEGGGHDWLVEPAPLRSEEFGVG